MSTNTANLERAKASQMFMGLTTTPLAIPITSTTAPKCILWNPTGSGVNVILVRYTAGWVSGTSAPGNVMLSLTSPAGSAVATAAPFSAFTAGVQRNCFIGGGGGTGQARFGIAATLSGAGTAFYGLGLNHLTTTGAANAQTGWTMEHVFNDSVILAPGNAVHTVASAATVTIFNETFVWYEEAA